jgi:hypothetical protein
MKIRKLIFVVWGVIAGLSFSCVDQQNDIREDSTEFGDNPYNLEVAVNEKTTVKGNDVIIPDESMMIEKIEVKDRSTENAAYVPNPNGYAVSVNSPYSGDTETTYYWGPPSHGIYWGGDWSGDFWLDNGNTSADFGNFISCYKNVYLDVNGIQYPGGQVPQSLKARLLEFGYACASANYNDGGYTQKWEIIAVNNGVETSLGWILYAHLASNVVYSVGTTLNLNGPVKIGTTFSTGSSNGCWGSCHLHIELFNNANWACYDVNPPETRNSRIGILGGLGSSTAHCPSISSTTNWARNAINCGRSSAYNSNYDCNKTYDGVVSASSKWVSNGVSRTSWMTLDLGAYRNINQFVVKHAGSVGEPAISNTKAFQIQYGSSMSGPWTTYIYGNNSGQANQSTYSANLNARYIALLITDPGADNYTRIVEFEVKGQ